MSVDFHHPARDDDGFAGQHRQTVVLVVRDPDASNEITVYDPPVGGLRTIDVDLGYCALDDPTEFLGWLGAQDGVITDLPDDHPAGEAIYEIIEGIWERYHKSRWSSVEDAIQAAIEVV